MKQQTIQSRDPHNSRVLRGHDSLQVEMHNAHENRRLFLILGPESTFVSFQVLCTLPQLSCYSENIIYHTHNRVVNRNECKVCSTVHSTELTLKLILSSLEATETDMLHIKPYQRHLILKMLICCFKYPIQYKYKQRREVWILVFIFYRLHIIKLPRFH
jgi:hypothetical protein